MSLRTRLASVPFLTSLGTREWARSRKSVDFRFVCPPPHSWVGIKLVIKTEFDTTQPLRFELNRYAWKEFKKFCHEPHPLYIYYVQELLSIYYYRHNIQNSLKYTLSNGCVEGTNNKIKVIKRTSYGYRNFYHLRSRIILSTAHNNMKNEAYRPLLFTEEDAIKKYEEENQKQLEMQNKIV